MGLFSNNETLISTRNIAIMKKRNAPVYTTTHLLMRAACGQVDHGPRGLALGLEVALLHQRDHRWDKVGVYYALDLRHIAGGDVADRSCNRRDR